MTIPDNRPTLNPMMGKTHISRDSNRGYLEQDPYIEIDRRAIKLPGQHGLMNIPAEIHRTAISLGMQDTPIIRSITKDS